MPSAEDTKVRRVVPSEQAGTGVLHKRVCTDVRANVNTLGHGHGVWTHVVKCELGRWILSASYQSPIDLFSPLVFFFFFQVYFSPASINF